MANFSQKHEDIKLTKEETEFLEQQFFKYVQKEMEKNSSNWKEYYDILKESTNIPDEKASASGEGVQSQSKNTKQKPAQTSASSRFKVNTEKTKQQYKEQDTTTRTKWQNHTERSQQHRPNNSKNKDSSSSTGQRKPRKQEQQNRQNHKQQQPKPTDRFESNQPPQAEEKEETPQPHPKHNEDDGPTGATDERYPKTLKGKLLYTAKYVVLIFLCFVAIVVLQGFRFAWWLVKFMFTYTTLLLWFVSNKMIGFASHINGKHEITSKLSHYFHNTLEVIHLVLGINFKDIFWRMKWWSREPKTTTAFHFDGPPPDLPESSMEAVSFLSKQNVDNPYRVLCVNSKATIEEIKNNYRKLVRLVHPDKCNIDTAEDSFKNTSFKKLSDADKRKEVDDELDRQRLWDEYNARMGDECQNMFEHLTNTIYCDKCGERHKKTLVAERTIKSARYCERCNEYHVASDGDVWAEMGLLGMNWKCFACIHTEVYEITDWAICQGLKRAIPANHHRVACRMGTRGGRKKNAQETNETAAGGRHRKGGKRNKRRK